MIQSRLLFLLVSCFGYLNIRVHRRSGPTSIFVAHKTSLDILVFLPWIKGWVAEAACWAGWSDGGH